MDESLPDERNLKTLIEDYVADNEGMVIGYVAMVEYIDADGDISVMIARPDEQPTYRSLGYTSYLTEWFKDDAVHEMNCGMFGDDE